MYARARVGGGEEMTRSGVGRRKWAQVGHIGRNDPSRPSRGTDSDSKVKARRSTQSYHIKLPAYSYSLTLSPSLASLIFTDAVLFLRNTNFSLSRPTQLHTIAFVFLMFIYLPCLIFLLVITFYLQFCLFAAHSLLSCYASLLFYPKRGGYVFCLSSVEPSLYFSDAIRIT